MLSCRENWAEKSFRETFWNKVDGIFEKERINKETFVFSISRLRSFQVLFLLPHSFFLCPLTSLSSPKCIRIPWITDRSCWTSQPMTSGCVAHVNRVVRPLGPSHFPLDKHYSHATVFPQISHSQTLSSAIYCSFCPHRNRLECCFASSSYSILFGWLLKLVLVTMIVPHSQLVSLQLMGWKDVHPISGPGLILRYV